MKGYFSRWPHRLYRVNLDRERGEPDTYDEPDGYDGANVVSSQLAESEMHTLVIDLDVPAVLVPSETPGHTHLFIDVPMTWQQYQHVLRSLAQCGVLQQGYVDASLARGFTSVRLPWIRKFPTAPATPRTLAECGEFWAHGNSIAEPVALDLDREEPIF